MRVSSQNIDLQSIYEELKEYSKWTEQNLVDFIDVASKCVNNGETLFDSRYHMFIRSLEGAFVTLKPKLQIRLSRHKFIDDLVAYEIGVCKYCNSIYIIGYHDEKNHVLLQNEDVDLLEPVGEYLFKCDSPTEAIISIGATRYTKYGEKTFWEVGDEMIVAVYNHTKWSFKEVKNDILNHSYHEKDMSVLAQIVD